MGKKTEKAPTSSQAGEFRRQAEKRLRIKKTASGGVTSETDVRALLHELQAHQIELEMLNEELQRAWAAAEESSQNYCDLFDFAPVGYFLWDRQGLIAEVNLTGGRVWAWTETRSFASDSDSSWQCQTVCGLLSFASKYWRRIPNMPARSKS